MLCPPETLKSFTPRWPVRVLHTLYRIDRREALNCAAHRAEVQGTGQEIAAQLKQATNGLKAAGIDVETGTVDYPALANSEAYRAYTAATAALCDYDPASLTSDDERLAFWLNLYNALVIHAVIAVGVRERVTEARGFFERAAYIVNGYRLSADDIEHGILRANAGHPFLPGRQFGPHDPRRAMRLPQRDPRLHFALNCGATSCPPISFYSAENLDAQLDLAARNFLNGGGARLERKNGVLWLSRIFSWYATDFGAALYGYRGQHRLLAYVRPYLNDEADQAYLDDHATTLRVRFLPYDWSLNR
ncbi:MAG: DUF547 domain-containing protein [Chloroflexi bacterium]|nr:DUF547 domain-containing protein [Chloroflexota bacterium]